MPIISPQFDLQAEFPDLDSEDSDGEETGKDITWTDIESQNQKAEVAADDVLPVQIERRFNELSYINCTQLNPSPFLSVFLHTFVYSKYKGTDHLTWSGSLQCAHLKVFLSISVLKI
jgi:hypothetical protein